MSGEVVRIFAAHQQRFSASDPVSQGPCGRVSSVALQESKGRANALLTSWRSPHFFDVQPLTAINRQSDTSGGNAILANLRATAAVGGCRPIWQMRSDELEANLFQAPCLFKRNTDAKPRRRKGSRRDFSAILSVFAALRQILVRLPRRDTQETASDFVE